MSDVMLDSATGVDQGTMWWTRWLAERTPRRSFLGKAGRGLVASSVGGGAALALFSESAYASGGCGCNGYESVSCGCLTGSNSCPSGTCECGCWAACTTLCPSPQATYWCDCCNTSPQGSTCIGGCSSFPSNCFAQEWSGGQCSTGYTIRCRYHYCTSFGVTC